MNKAMLWIGGVLVVLGAMTFGLFVLPWIGGGPPEVVAGRPAGGLPALAVAAASFGLAAGSALVGIGLGRWKRPRPSPHDGSPEA